jgi:hypothetical protein
MATERFTLDLASSSLKLRTRAKGLLSKLAHDLELDVTSATGEGERDGEAWNGKLSIAAEGIKVAGVLKKHGVDRDVLSSRDVADIEKRIRDDVFAHARQIAIDASGKLSRGDLDVHVGARGQRALVLVEWTTRDRGVELRAKGEVSMKALGLAEVKGPLGAFTVSDAVEWDARLVFVANPVAG